MFGLGEVAVTLAFLALLYFLIKSKNRFLRICVAGAGCFGGLALVVNGGRSEWIVIGVLVGGIGLATLLRFMSQLIADEINNATGAPEEPS